MSNILPFLAVASDAVVVNARRVMDAIGQGPGTFARALVAADDETATPETPAVGWVMQHMSADDDLVVQINAITHGDLPGTVNWGEGEVISAVEAIAAFGGGNVQIRAAGGLDENGVTGKTPTQWRDDEFAAMNVKFRPAGGMS